MSIIDKAFEKSQKKNEFLEENKIVIAKTSTSDTPIIISATASDSATKIELSNTKNTAKTSINKKSKQITLDWLNLAEKGFLTPLHSNLQLAEEYRIIKRPLVNNVIHGENNGINRANVILVASSLPNEGKSFSAINLAISIASEQDKQVLLIDADVAKPSVAKYLNIQSEFGLIDYLEGTIEDLSEIMLDTNMDGLRIVSSGKIHEYSTELLASNKMRQLVEELSTRYNDRIIIFDSPPLLVASQGEVLASMVGQIVLVIEAEKTAQSIVMESIGKLKACDVVLLLLNKSMKYFDMNYYGYGIYGNDKKA